MKKFIFNQLLKLVNFLINKFEIDEEEILKRVENLNNEQISE